MMRSAVLEAAGWRVLRFWNDVVLQDIDGVRAHVLATVRPDKPTMEEMR